MNNQPDRNQNNAQRTNGPLRPLTDEEKKRILAARHAAQQNSDARNRPMTDQERAEAIRRLQASRAGNASKQNAQQTKSSARKRRPARINKGALLFILIVLAVLIVSLIQINRNGQNVPAADPLYERETLSLEDGPIPDESETAESETETEEEPPAPNTFESETVLNSTLDEGDLILVNTKYPYAKADTVALSNVYGAPTAVAKVANTGISMADDAMNALDAMNTAFIQDTGCDDLMIVSGHRTTADQQRIYDSYLAENGQDYVDSYVALPGRSEHHTGLACDLTFYTDDGYSVPLADHENGGWFGENCHRYGFIRRYPADKVELTGFAYEAWHFRYVGIPHAYACTAFGYCYEEYIDALKAYTADTKMLYVSKDGKTADASVSEPLPASDGWLVYYVPMAEGDSTEIPVPAGPEFADRVISGNNADGFIVTVSLG